MVTIVIYTTPSDSRAMRRNSRYDVVGWRRDARALDMEKTMRME